MVESISERDGGICTERRYYLSSASLSAQQFAVAVGADRGIENRLHWVMDVIFNDDLMRLRTGHGPANLATVRDVALNIMKSINDKASLKVRRKKIGWNEDYLFNAITS